MIPMPIVEVLEKAREHFPQLKWYSYLLVQEINYYVEVETKSGMDKVTRKLSLQEQMNASMQFWADLIWEMAEEVLLKSYEEEFKLCGT